MGSVVEWVVLEKEESSRTSAALVPSALAAELQQSGEGLGVFRMPPGMLLQDGPELKAALKELEDVAKSGERAQRGAKAESAVDREHEQELSRRSWAVAFGSAQQLLYSGFMLWMAGSGVHIFSIMTAMTCLFMGVQALLVCLAPFSALQAADPRFSGLRVLPQKTVALFMAGVPVVLAVRKCIAMKFLPTAPADWIALLPLYEHEQRISTLNFL